MTAPNKQALRDVAEMANRCRLKRMSIDPFSVLALLDENESMARDLISRNGEIEGLRQRIAELEARTPYGYLRQCDGQIQISIGSERPHDRSGGYATPWFAIYTAAGIGVKGD